MAFDFKKIKDSFIEKSKKSIEGIKSIFKGTDDMKKQKKKKNKKTLLEIMGFEKQKPIKKKSSSKKKAKTTKSNDNRKTVRTVKLRKSHRRVVISRVLWLAFLVALVFLGMFSYKLTNNFIHDRNETDIPVLIGELNETNSFKLNIPRGSRTTDIAEILIENGIISDKKIVQFTYFELYSRLMGNDGGYKSGNHWINTSVDYDNPIGYDMLVYILSQNPIPNPTATIFFAEGLTFKQTIERFIEEEFLDPVKFTEVCNEYEFDYDFIEEIPQNGRYNRFEGYLFPDTYIFDKTKPEEEAIDKMLQNFDTKFNDIFKERLEVIDMTMDEIIIIASLIEREAQIDADREVISGVIYNRLNSSDSSLNYLQIDATIQYYLLNETGEVKENLLTEDTLIDSLYNTYRYPGLPLGPICNPGELSIRAALYPDTHNYYYYVAKGDGGHAFAETLREHNNNVIKYLD